MKKNAFPLFFLAFYFVWTIRATWFYSVADMSITNETLRLVFSNSVKFILWVIPAAAFIFWLEREDPLEKMKIKTPVNSNRLILIAIAAILYFVITVFVEYLVSSRTLLPLIQAPLSKIFGTLAAISFSPVIEEIFFRGFVLSQLESKFSFWKANVIQAFLFTIMHWPYWIWSKGIQIQIVITSASIFILAIFLGWILKKSNSIWPPVIVHIINNFLAAFLG